MLRPTQASHNRRPDSSSSDMLRTITFAERHCVCMNYSYLPYSLIGDHYIAIQPQISFSKVIMMIDRQIKLRSFIFFIPDCTSLIVFISVGMNMTAFSYTSNPLVCCIPIFSFVDWNRLCVDVSVISIFEI